jgi:cytochrome P450
MSDEQLRYEAMTLFTAGHETTANALVWTWLLLAQNPEAEARLHEELRRELGDRPPTVADVPRLVYTRAVLAESMRLYPPAWIVGRQAVEAFRAGEYEIPAGGVVLMSQFLVHRDERWWPDAGAFRPERWMEEVETENGRTGEPATNAVPGSPLGPLAGSVFPRPRYAYFPFGGGPRQCIGESFAWLEGVLLIATIARRWRFAAAAGAPAVRLHATITLRPRDALPMTVAPATEEQGAVPTRAHS